MDEAIDEAQVDILGVAVDGVLHEPRKELEPVLLVLFGFDVHQLLLILFIDHDLLGII
jgi:hypothetical protein